MPDGKNAGAIVAERRVESFVVSIRQEDGKLLYLNGRTGYGASGFTANPAEARRFRSKDLADEAALNETCLYGTSAETMRCVRSVEIHRLPLAGPENGTAPEPAR